MDKFCQMGFRGKKPNILLSPKFVVIQYGSRCVRVLGDDAPLPCKYGLACEDLFCMTSSLASLSLLWHAAIRYTCRQAMADRHREDRTAMHMQTDGQLSGQAGSGYLAHPSVW